MPTFEYKALNSKGKEVKGSIESESARVARHKLKTQGIFTTEIREAKQAAAQTRATRDVAKLFAPKSVGAKTLAIGTRQLATLLVAGVPLVDSLQSLGEQTDSPVLRRITFDLKEKVEEGSSLAKALAAYPKTFPKIYINMVASGEASGTLDTVFENLADYLEANLDLRRKITGALTYPSLMLAFCTLVVVGLLTFVVPTIVEIFTKNNAVLPLPTRIMIGVSDTIIHGWYLILIAIFLMITGFIKYYRSQKGRAKIDLLLIKLPIFSPIYQKIYTARISLTLGALLQGGVGLLTALEIVRNTMSNVHIIKALDEAKEGVREGKSLSRELSRSGLFPNMFPQMTAVGEKSGRLESMLEKAGKFYEKEVSTSLASLTSLIEPMMIIGVGMVVLVIVASILLPMTSLMDAIQR